MRGRDAMKGRPTLPPEARRNARVIVSLTPSEAAQVKEAARRERTPVAVYARRVVVAAASAPVDIDGGGDPCTP